MADAVDHMKAVVAAVLNEDIDGIICCFDAALRVFEGHPSSAPEHARLLNGLLIAILATCELCEALGRSAESSSLARRAVALREARIH